ncbi:aminoacyl-histidine dipeptidase [Porphyromonas cangingivalis]|uniref:Cytosol non-specific dipeptidase n=1 Tax=Porphyromonas cangingivalis TaxID=36874 RepID=A0A0A2EPS7_PORCN|nr:aminoacyl-histidine dipeptidase [Porphyromonas cangingivalis]KGN79717.1 aminoacyl-histidine dipeptidase [Porphyromonas cangingivalis]SJZ30795.1 dipeptidase D [Porphyromonas cangingivalis]VEJ04301.1 Cytosol non-specific dipeptidase [Porphyromonas cangingivalis]
MIKQEPQILFDYFYEITQVPRPSKKEGKIIAYLENFAKKHNLEYKKDEVGNIVIKKPATPGMEDRKSIIMQSHMDMVCEKNSDVTFDFENDAIRTKIVDGWLMAEGTTLGADNGIGCAAELAVLASNDIEHGPIECLFTVDEETGLTGAMALKEGFFDSEILLNLDSEDEGEMFVGCAGGMGTFADFTYEKMYACPEMHYLTVDVKGLRGGHSGGDIHVGLGNANKILARFLYGLYDIVDGWTLASFQGGNLHNAIPREAKAIIGVPMSQKEAVAVFANTFCADVRNELAAVDPDVMLTIGSTEKPEFVIDDTTKDLLISSLIACPHGVIGMSHAIEGLVETSTNLASVKMKENNSILIETSQRSSTESLKQMVGQMVRATFEIAGAYVYERDGYPGWAPNMNSEILKIAEESYESLFGKKPLVKAIHAGLECGLFKEKYPNLDMISFGPTMRDVHSPVEKLELSTVDLWWKHLLDILRRAPKK